MSSLLTVKVSTEDGGERRRKLFVFQILLRILEMFGKSFLAVQSVFNASHYRTITTKEKHQEWGHITTRDWRRNPELTWPPLKGLHFCVQTYELTQVEVTALTCITFTKPVFVRVANTITDWYRLTIPTSVDISNAIIEFEKQRLILDHYSRSITVDSRHRLTSQRH